MRPLRALLVGCGLIAEKKYLPTLKALRGELLLEGLCDTDEALARRLARTFRVPSVHRALGSALQELHPEFVVLCTPPQTHRALGIQILGAGSHLFLEKPMALTVADCEALILSSQTNQRQICVAFSQSFTPAVLEALSLIEAGALGRLQGMEVFLSTPSDYMTADKDHWVHRLPGGVLSETGPHLVHLAMRFLGPVRQTLLTARKHLSFPWSAADDFRITLACERGTCSAALLYTTNHWAARVDLIGQEGRLTLDQQSGLVVRHRRENLSPLAVLRSGLAEASQILWGSARNGGRLLMNRRQSGHSVLLKQFLRSLRDGSPLPVSPLEGLNVARTLEALLQQLGPGG